jgi:hypothetical protein
MSEFLSNNWVWILLIGGMVFMHLGHRGGHRGGHGGHGGCGGGHQHSSHQRTKPDEDTAATSHPGHDHPSASAGQGRD